MQRDATEVRVFDKVWYRSHPLRPTDLSVRAMEDVGTLSVAAGSLVFVGARRSVEVSNVVSVSRRRHGRDFVNRWITVTYGQDQIAMFVDAGIFGWRGIFGGNRRIHEAIRDAFGDSVNGGE